MFDTDDIIATYTKEGDKEFYMITNLPTDDDEYPEDVAKVFLDKTVEYIIEEAKESKSVQRVISFVLENKL